MIAGHFLVSLIYYALYVLSKLIQDSIMQTKYVVSLNKKKPATSWLFNINQKHSNDCQ